MDFLAFEKPENPEKSAKSIVFTSKIAIFSGLFGFFGFSKDYVACSDGGEISGSQSLGWGSWAGHNFWPKCPKRCPQARPYSEPLLGGNPTMSGGYPKQYECFLFGF